MARLGRTGLSPGRCVPADEDDEHEDHAVWRLSDLGADLLPTVEGAGDRRSKPRGEGRSGTDFLDAPYGSDPPELRDLGDPEVAAVRWRRWSNWFENYIVAQRIKEDSVKLVCMVEFGGKELEQINREFAL